MKGIYITEEGKKELEVKIAELEILKEDCEDCIWREYNSSQVTYQEILSSAIVLPVEKSWIEVCSDYDDTSDFFKKCYPNGLVIQPK
jgi:hypothetical protein